MPADKARHKLHEDCIAPWLAIQKAKAATKAAKEQKARQRVEKAMDRKRKEALKTLPMLLKAAQRSFNAYIRERDKAAGHPCISSGRPLNWAGNDVDAGHYRSVGAAPHLRFNEANVHAQSKHDNQWKAGNVVDYRINLIARIGLPAVEALENNNVVHKWGRSEVIAIKAMYDRRTKQLKEAA